jgi:diguanylate cyclase (GGDEF)-like protein
VPSQDALSPLAIVGLSTQVAGAALITLLFLLLRRHAARHQPFRLWCAAWSALTVALIALMPWVRAFDADSGPPNAPLTALWLGLSVYQLGKLTYLLLLVLGLLVFTHGIRWRRWLVRGIGIVLAAWVTSLWASTGLDGALAWQAPIVVGVTVTGSLLLATLPRLRRTLGTRVTGSALAMLAVLWSANVLDLWAPPGGWAQQPLAQGAALASAYGTFGDVVLQILLGLGMVVILFESNMREAAAAHQELQISHRHLERQAFLDPLTGAYNRAAFDAGHGLVLAATSFGAVVVFDLDGLKAVNDTHGHAAGDVLLRHFAETARGLLRTSDSLYRWGGDEFVAVMPGASAPEVARRLSDGLANAPCVPLPDGRAVPLAASLGAASFTSGATLAAAVAVADRRMLDDKMQRRQLAHRSA